MIKDLDTIKNGMPYKTANKDFLVPLMSDKWKLKIFDQLIFLSEFNYWGKTIPGCTKRSFT